MISGQSRLEQAILGPLQPQQALRSSCELLREILISKELHANSWNCLQAYETACKHMKLHASFHNS